MIEALNKDVEIPKIWGDFFRCLGDTHTTYGLLKLSCPIGSIISILLNGLRYYVHKNNEAEHDVENYCCAKYQEPVLELLRNIESKRTDSYYILMTNEDSKEYAKKLARQIWNEEVTNPVEVIVEGVKSEVCLDPIEEILDGDHKLTDIVDGLSSLGLAVDTKIRLVTLIEIAEQGFPSTVLDGCREFCFIKGSTLTDLMEAVLTALRGFFSLTSAILKRLYNVEPFVPSKSGSSAQFIVRDPIYPKYQSKVNLSSYLQALEYLLDVTKNVTIVRTNYVAHTELTSKDRAAFAMKDLKSLL